MCEVAELSAYYDGRFERILACREMVGEDPREREEVLLQLNREVRELQEQVAVCRRELHLWRDSVQEGDRWVQGLCFFL